MPKKIKKYKSFLGKDYPPPKPEKAVFQIISAPYEDNISYGAGTSRGPSAIITASQFLEIYGGNDEPVKLGIYTRPFVKCDGSPQKVLKKIESDISDAMKYDAVPILFGGEHTVSYAMAKALFERYGSAFSIVHFDSHCDLRERYYGNRFSHACVMRRIHEDFKVQILQIATRAYSKEEDDYRKVNMIPAFDAPFLKENGIPEKIIPDNFLKRVFVSFDVDALDPSIMPSTGTPEPGGISWYEATQILEKISVEAQIIAFDIVELAPIKKLHHSDYTTAKLAYKIMSLCKKAQNINQRRCL